MTINEVVPNELIMPDGYSLFVGQQDLNMPEVNRLRMAVWWPRLNAGAMWDYWIGCANPDATIFGVREIETGELAGISRIEGNLDLSILAGLAVHPKHQHKGIGQALVRERVKTADQRGIKQLITRLAVENTLPSFYEELGFEPADGGSIRRTAPFVLQ